MTNQDIAASRITSHAHQSFLDQLEGRWADDRFLCVGLDPDYEQIPGVVKDNLTRGDALFKFNRAIIDVTQDLVCSYKPNSSFYEAEGTEGLTALMNTVHYIKTKCPGIPVILDAKRADIGTSNLGYVESAFDLIGADAITVHPYFGKEALQPFLRRKDRGILVLTKTSNPGAGEFQDLSVGVVGEPLYLTVARQVASSWNSNGNCGFVVGATYPGDLKAVRDIVGDMPILIPGIGSQGGSIEDAVTAGRDSRGRGMIISSSRDIIYASRDKDFAEAARRVAQALHSEISRYAHA